MVLSLLRQPESWKVIFLSEPWNNLDYRQHKEVDVILKIVT
jgi:hypothetical protein